MLEDQPYTKLVIVISVIAFSAIGLTLYLPQFFANTASGDVLTNSGVLLGIGVFGIILVLISPIFFIESFYAHEYVDAFLYGMLFLVIGIVLVLAWLW